MEKFDHLYISITKEVGGLEGLFNSMFSFLLRRTDFFYESDPGDKMGFPPGVNEKMLLNIFNQYRDVYYKNTPKKSVDEYARKYVAYAKKNNLPLPNGVKQDVKSQPKSLPKIAPLESTKVKSQKKEKILKKDTQPKKNITPKKESSSKTKKALPDKPKNSLYSDIR